MKRMIIALAILLIGLPQLIQGQNQEQDPLAESGTIRRGGDELIGIRAELKSGSQYDLLIEVSRYFHVLNDVVKVLEYKGPVVNRNFNAYGITKIDANGNGLSEIVAAWIIDNRVELVALTADPNLLGFTTIGSGDIQEFKAEWQDTVRLSKTQPVPFAAPSWLRTPPRLVAGDFSGNGTEKLALAYAATHQDNSVINLSVFDVAGSITERAFSRVQPLVVDQPVALQPSGRPLGVFDLATGDFNGDGKDEILLVGRQSDGTGNWNLYASIYALSSPTQLVRILHEVIYTMPDSDQGMLYEIQDIRVASGPLTGNGAHQAVVSFTQYNSHDIYASFMIGLSFDQALSQITASAEPFRRARANQVGQGAYWDNVVRIGDINGDGRGEIVSNAGYHTSRSLNIYRLNSDLQFIEYATNVGIPQLTSPVFTLGRLNMGDYDENNLVEIATANQALYSIHTKTDGSYSGVAPAINPDFGLYGCWFPGGVHQYDCTVSLLTAELDGDIRIGTPRRFRISNITQPLVVIKAPPTHFDILDGVVYDISNNYYPNNPAQPGFLATYIVETSQTKTIETVFTRDWGVSGSLSGGGNFLGAGVSGYLQVAYGKRFTEKGTKTETVTVGHSVSASRDDRIYASTMSYDIWEYPVISEGLERGHIMVVDPAVTQLAWLTGTSGDADTYIAAHEAGNLLSYRESPPGTNEIGVNDIILGPVFELSESIVADGWWLNINEIDASSISKKKDFSIDAGVSAKKWGVKLEVKGYYETSDLTTQTTTLTDNVSVRIGFSALPAHFGTTTSYKVQPYVYWSEDGALVLDYAVQLPLPSGPGAPSTFWSQKYASKPDPGFILPWRYWKEKWGAESHHERRFQTRDISFYPEKPEIGDIVTISARVHNFSLVPVNERVGVTFYLGDPDNGGTPITGLGGATTYYTDSGIGARRTKSVEMQWAIPDHIVGTRPRIYGLIHTEEAVPEIHTNNNLGWSILGKESFATGIDDDNVRNKPDGFVLHQNYPNPFNPVTTFEFSTPAAGMVTLEVYNILGQRIATLVSGHLAAGDHRLNWHAGGITSGVYIFRLQAAGFVESRKLMILK